QRHRADGRLELVGDVRDEVAPHRVDAARLRLVIAQHQDEGGPQCGHARVEVAGRGGGAHRVLEVDLLDEAAGADPRDDLEETLDDERVPAHQSEGVGGGRSLDDVVAGVDDDRGTGEHGENLGDAVRQLVVRVQVGGAATALGIAERQDPGDPEPQSHGSREHGDDEQIHT